MPKQIKDNTREFTVADPQLAFQTLANSTPVHQVWRELLQNALQAGAKRVVIELNADVGDGGLKLSVVDDGEGMSAKGMVKFLGNLASSGRDTGPGGNFGIGAKITALPHNPFGVVYESWRNGVGRELTLWRNPETGKYGVRLHGVTATRGLVDTYRPTSIVSIADHGTRVTLMGHSLGDSSLAPFGPTPNKAFENIRTILTERFFRLPEGVEVLVCNNSPGRRARRIVQIHGQHEELRKNSESFGCVDVDGAKVHWFLRNAEREGVGITGIVFQHEIFDPRRGNDANGRLHAAGLFAIRDRVSLWVEPNENGLSMDAGRSQIISSSGDLPWQEWLDSFKKQMPKQLRAAIRKSTQREAIIDGDVIAHRVVGRIPMNIIDRLRQIGLSSSAGSQRDFSKREKAMGRSSSRSTNGRRTASGANQSHKEGLSSIDLATASPLELLRALRIVPSVLWKPLHPESAQGRGRTQEFAQYDKVGNLLTLDPNFATMQDAVDTVWKTKSSDPAVRDLTLKFVKDNSLIQVLEAVVQVRIAEVLGEISPQAAHEQLGKPSLTMLGRTMYGVMWGAGRSVGSQMGSSNGALL